MKLHNMKLKNPKNLFCMSAKFRFMSKLFYINHLTFPCDFQSFSTITTFKE